MLPLATTAPAAPASPRTRPTDALARRLPFHLDDHVAVDALCAARPDARSRACLALWAYLSVRRYVLHRLVRQSGPCCDADGLVARIYRLLQRDGDACASAADYLVRIDMIGSLLFDRTTAPVLKTLRAIPVVVDGPDGE